MGLEAICACNRNFWQTEFIFDIRFVIELTLLLGATFLSSNSLIALACAPVSTHVLNTLLFTIISNNNLLATLDID